MANWQTPKTDWAAEDGVMNTDFNRIEENSQYLHDEMDRVSSYALDENISIYVDALGDDTTGDGTSGAPFRTITKALTLVPKNINGRTVVINVDGGVYSESVDIIDYYGGQIKITGNGEITVNDLTVANGSRVIIEYLSLNINGTLTVRNKGFFFSPMSVTVGGHTFGIYALNGGECIIDGSTTINNTSTFGASAMSGGRVYLSRLYGTGNNIGLYASLGGLVTYVSSSISATTAAVSESGGRIYSGAQTSIPKY
jgi:hypothetical protein